MFYPVRWQLTQEKIRGGAVVFGTRRGVGPPGSLSYSSDPSELFVYKSLPVIMQQGTLVIISGAVRRNYGNCYVEKLQCRFVVCALRLFSAGLSPSTCETAAVGRWTGRDIYFLFRILAASTNLSSGTSLMQSRSSKPPSKLIIMLIFWIPG